MKKIFTSGIILTIVFFSRNGFSQSGLTNLNFEAVTSTTMLGCSSSTIFPTGFKGSEAFTNGGAPGYTMTQTAQSGSKYITILNLNTCGHVDLNPLAFVNNPNSSAVGSPYANKPVAFCGYFRTQGISNAGDTVSIIVNLTKSGALVGKGIFNYAANQATWTNFCANIVYTSTLTPDTVRIRFTPSRILANGGAFTSQSIILDVDNCSFTLATALQENTIENKINIFPNPASDKIIIETNGNSILNEIDVRVMNIIGKTVFEEKIKGQKNELDLGKLPEGVYYVSLNSASLKEMKKIIISR